MSAPFDPLKGLVPTWRRLYFKFKSLRNVPFRKKWFIGYDLEGNTFWEMNNLNFPTRPRRIIFPRETHLNLVDYKLAPQWVQWLRHARPHAPTLEELINDQNRQAMIKLKAAAAEQKWKSIPLKEEADSKLVSELHESVEKQDSTEKKDKPASRKPAQLKL